MNKQTDKSPQKLEVKSPSESPGRRGRHKKKQVVQNALDIQQQVITSWREDNSYGFDFAVYPEIKRDQHTHSIALVKQINEFNTMADLQKWIKIANSVNKEMWLSDNQNNVLCKLKFCKNC